jgi:hypothetical protein
MESMGADNGRTCQAEIKILPKVKQHEEASEGQES